MIRSRFAVLLVFLLVASAAFAQSNDVAVSFGGILSPSVRARGLCEVLPVCPFGVADTTVNPGFSIAGAYSNRLLNHRLVSSYFELPFMFSPVRNAGRFNPDFSSFFFTPSVKVKLLPSSGISPFFSAGGGLGRFKENSASDNRGAFQVGGGLDLKTRLPLLGFRLEARDFITGVPGTSTFRRTTSDHLHSIFVGGGVTLHF